MNRFLAISLMGICFIGLSACALSDRTFIKAGVTDSQREQDIQACWDYTLNSEEGRQKADMIRLAQFVGGGPMALVVRSAYANANNNDIRKEAGNMGTHNGCMADRGYEISVPS